MSNTTQATGKVVVAAGAPAERHSTLDFSAEHNLLNKLISAHARTRMTLANIDALAMQTITESGDEDGDDDSQETTERKVLPTIEIGIDEFRYNQLRPAFGPGRRIGSMDWQAAFLASTPVTAVAQPGLYVVTGRAVAGKSYFLSLLHEEIAKRDQHVSVMLPFLEPNVTRDGVGPAPALHPDWIATRLAAASAELAPSVFLLDSLRIMQYESGGETLKGGLSAGFLTTLSTLSILAEQRGVAIFASFNPNVKEVEEYQRMIELITGAVTGVITLTDRVRADFANVQLNTRYGDRQAVSFAMQLPVMLGLKQTTSDTSSDVGSDSTNAADASGTNEPVRLDLQSQLTDTEASVQQAMRAEAALDTTADPLQSFNFTDL